MYICAHVVYYICTCMYRYTMYFYGSKYMQCSLVPRPLPVFLGRTGKRESLGGKIMCGQLCNHFVQQGIEPYTNCKNRVSSAICVVFHSLWVYQNIWRYYKWYLYSDRSIGREFSLSLIWVQNSSIQFRTLCTLLTVMLISFWLDPWSDKQNQIK